MKRDIRKTLEYADEMEVGLARANARIKKLEAEVTALQEATKTEHAEIAHELSVVGKIMRFLMRGFAGDRDSRYYAGALSFLYDIDGLPEQYPHETYDDLPQPPEVSQ